jgi:hypothetical protein
MFTGMGSITEMLAVAVPGCAGSSVVSTLTTTYATQSRERRQARAAVRDTMRAVESAAVATKTSGAEMRQR